jgi:hypothetical protein
LEYRWSLEEDIGSPVEVGSLAVVGGSLVEVVGSFLGNLSHV